MTSVSMFKQASLNLASARTAGVPSEASANCATESGPTPVRCWADSVPDEYQTPAYGGQQAPEEVFAEANASTDMSSSEPLGMSATHSPRSLSQVTRDSATPPIDEPVAVPEPQQTAASGVPAAEATYSSHPATNSSASTSSGTWQDGDYYNQAPAPAAAPQQSYPLQQQDASSVEHCAFAHAQPPAVVPQAPKPAGASTGSTPLSPVMPPPTLQEASDERDKLHAWYDSIVQWVEEVFSTTGSALPPPPPPPNMAVQRHLRPYDLKAWRMRIERWHQYVYTEYYTNFINTPSPNTMAQQQQNEACAADAYFNGGAVPPKESRNVGPTYNRVQPQQHHAQQRASPPLSSSSRPQPYRSPQVAALNAPAVPAPTRGASGPVQTQHRTRGSPQHQHQRGNDVAGSGAALPPTSAAVAAKDAVPRPSYMAHQPHGQHSQHNPYGRIAMEERENSREY